MGGGLNRSHDAVTSGQRGAILLIGYENTVVRGQRPLTDAAVQTSQYGPYIVVASSYTELYCNEGHSQCFLPERASLGRLVEYTATGTNLADEVQFPNPAVVFLALMPGLFPVAARSHSISS